MRERSSKRIIIEPGTYLFDNMGDIAMLQVCVVRLRNVWPDAQIKMLTRSPERMVRFCPGTEALDGAACHRWLLTENGTRKRKRYCPGFLAKSARSLTSSFRKRCPQAALGLLRLRDEGGSYSAVTSFLRAIQDADLFVVSGQGGFADPFWKQAMSVLDLLEFAQAHGCRTAMMSQGVGPLSHPEVLDKARRVLPRVDCIALREDRCGLPLLKSLGVRMDRVVTPGDDAIQMAYRAAPPSVGRAIGVNLRTRPYANPQEQAVSQIRSVLMEVAQQRKTELLAIPILHRPGTDDDDVASIGRLLNREASGIDSGPLTPALCPSEGARVPLSAGEGGSAGSPGLHGAGCAGLDTPAAVIQQVGRCRVVVAGSYHAAVFALAQGIPAVGISGSDYYSAKFLGLAAQFGGGCEVVFLDDQAFPAKLRTAIDNAWDSAEVVRPRLLAAAVRQIEAGQLAYERLRQIVEGGIGGPVPASGALLATRG